MYKIANYLHTSSTNMFQERFTIFTWMIISRNYTNIKPTNQNLYTQYQKCNKTSMYNC